MVNIFIFHAVFVFDTVVCVFVAVVCVNVVVALVVVVVVVVVVVYIFVIAFAVDCIEVRRWCKELHAPACAACKGCKVEVVLLHPWKRSLSII